VQCLYCGKGIGPIRQLRDREFCSEPHRVQFRERYRQSLYEALSPEAAPVRMADFIERPPAHHDPAPSAVLRLLRKSLSGVRELALDIDRAGMSAAQPAWIFGQNLAAIGAQLVWQGSAAAYPLPAIQPGFPVASRPPGRSTAGAAATHFAAADLASRQPVAAAQISSSRRPPDSVSLPEPAPVSAAVRGEPRAPQLRATSPAPAEPAATGPVAPTPAVALPGNTTIARPAAPAGPDSAPKFGLTPASGAGQPRFLEAGPLPIHTDVSTAAWPVAFEAPGARAGGIVLPKLPQAAASSAPIASIDRLKPAAPEARSPVAADAASGGPIALASRLREVLPNIQGALPAAEPAESATRQALDLAPMAPTADPRPSGPPLSSALRTANRTASSGNSLAPLGSLASPPAECSPAAIGGLAGLVQPEDNPVREAGGHQDLRVAAAAALPRFETPGPLHPPFALPGASVAAKPPVSMAHPDRPASAAPPAGAPAWDPAMAASPDRIQVPVADIAVPPVDYLPAPAGAVAGVGPLPPDVGRSLRSCAVLWTLRVVHMCNPEFRTEPIKARFSDLLRADRNMHYVQEAADRPKAKSNVLPFRREVAALSSRTKWQYVGMAAAALLLAGVLRPLAASKSFSVALPWHGMSIGQWMSERATRTYADNFRGGLNQWKSVQPKWPKSWSYSTDGFIHPGQLALYRPSVPLSDYRFEFMAQIENKSVDWVVRARDANNYYAMKFAVLQPGPRPVMAMIRYPVIGGHKGNRVQTPLRMMIHANTPYRVTVDVKGNRYRAYIEGQEADYWTDDALTAGGVGFFGEAGESARVYWVKLESHGDILGNICGWLSGKSSQTAMIGRQLEWITGRWKARI
jgi:hypothetical protein